MATIIEGTQYALTSQIEKNHSVVYVKLTDSALKAIEDYAFAITKGNVSNSVKPLIELRPNNSQGIIKIPNKLNDNNKKQDDNDKQCYNFSVKDIQNDGGILECVKQTNSNMSMESLGKIMLRMQIHANDDIYQKTKVKMAVVAEQEQKKYNTKVINSSDVSGRKVKVKRPFSSKFTASHSNNSVNSNANNNNTSSVSASNTFFNKQTTNLSMPRFNKYSNNQQQKSGYNSFYSNQSENLKKIREILMQLLTTKNYKLVDLTPKVQEKFKDIIDKNTIIQILNNIATFKDGSYHLNESTATSEELQQPDDNREQINQNNKRNLLVQNLHDIPTAANTTTTNIGKFNSSNNNNCPIANGNSISPYSDTSARSLSSPNSLNASPNNNNNKSNSPYPPKSGILKRNPEFLHTSQNNSKKFKSDNSRSQVVPKSHPANNSAIASYSPFDKVNNSNPLEHDSPDLRTQNNLYKTNPLSLNDTFNSSMNKTKPNDKEPNGSSQINSQIHQRNCGNGSSSMNSSPNSSPDSGISHIGNMLSSDSSFNNDSEDYLNKYTKIQNVNQLIRYKSDFNAEFPEYKKLYEYVESVSRQFEELKEMIQTKEEESDEWHDLIKQIFEKYDEVKNRSKYQKSQKRLIYLHYKLLHIKNLINQYMNNNNNGNEKCISSNNTISKMSNNSQIKL